MVDVRKLIAGSIVLIVSLLLAIQFMRTVEPAAANEVRAACKGLRPTGRSKTIRKFPSEAPDFTAVDHTGKPVKLSDFRGKVVFVNFWASWCKTCKAEKPSLIALQEKLGRDEFVVLSMASDIGWQPIRLRYPKGLPLKVLLDKAADEGEFGPIASAWGIKALPDSFVVDKNGTIRHYFMSKRDWDSDIALTCLRALTDE